MDNRVDEAAKWVPFGSGWPLLINMNQQIYSSHGKGGAAHNEVRWFLAPFFFCDAYQPDDAPSILQTI